FVVPLSLEVGRIIRGFESASTFNFKKLKYKGKGPCQGYQEFATTPSAPIRSSAAHAALDFTGTTKSKPGTLPPTPTIAHYIAHHTTPPKDRRT
ncbi:hypothetical protein, partial [Pseudomonas sp. TWI929]|uniref:hypothetical protein n=1 Tax=Pseudomonas sp. TWI929 TaxID=3136795 RepID=UPI00320B0E2F